MPARLRVRNTPPSPENVDGEDDDVGEESGDCEGRSAEVDTDTIAATAGDDEDNGEVPFDVVVVVVGSGSSSSGSVPKHEIRLNRGWDRGLATSTTTTFSIVFWLSKVVGSGAWSEGVGGAGCMSGSVGVEGSLGASFFSSKGTETPDDGS